MTKGKLLIRSTIAVAIIALLLTISIPVDIGARFIIWARWGQRHDAMTRQQSVRNLKNAEELLANCRAILVNATSYRPNPDIHGGPVNGAEDPDPLDPSLPPAVKALKPKGIYIEAGKMVMLEFGGGGGHFALRAFAQGARGYGSIEIVPGLWWYADEDLTVEADHK